MKRALFYVALLSASIVGAADSGASIEGTCGRFTDTSVPHPYQGHQNLCGTSKNARESHLSQMLLQDEVDLSKLEEALKVAVPNFRVGIGSMNDEYDKRWAELRFKNCQRRHFHVFPWVSIFRVAVSESARSDNKKKVVRMMILYGADINASNPLESAVHHDNCEIARLLIKEGANIDALGYDDDEMEKPLIELAKSDEMRALLSPMVKSAGKTNS